MADQYKRFIEVCDKFIKQLEIHVFADASNFAYAAAVYALNTGYEKMELLIYAKSRIAPIKGISIPKLELLSILIGALVLHISY
ncbi:unnamed protein product [Dracunculus medinensis]|uniref:RT_RNaseH_2 domain-containing protein n=1 Tax=Dracunculus medinensis TaxID=318479 RepID=A0A0N4UQI7_DRAME|nr:unnamed protein product [Dracunculus medinensis]